MFRKGFAFVCFSILMASFLTGCGGSPAAISVAITPSATTVDGTDSVTLTATVANDKTPGGVTWTTSGGGTLSSATTNPTTYTAPATTSSAQTITITATSVADTTKNTSVTLTVPAKLAITTTPTQLTGAVGTVYSVQLTTSLGVAPFKWTLDASSAALPTNWTLSSSGLLQGPAPMSGFTGGTYIFDVTDSGTPTAMTATATLTVTITQPAAITFTGTMPATGTYNTAYAGSAAATGGAGALTYSVVSGSLPTGLTLNTSTGAIGTTPTAPGTYNFTIQAADAFGDSNTQAYQVVIGKATPVLSFAAIAAQTYGAVPFQVTASDATSTPSTGAITYSLTAGQTSAGTVTSGGMVTITGIGTVYLTASQAATANYIATTATTSFTVAAEVPTLSFTTIPTQTFGVAPFQVTATDASGTPSAGAITYSLTAGHTSTGTVTSGGMVTVTGIGTIYLTATQAANGNYAVGTATTSFQVAAEVPTLTFTSIPTQTYGVAPFQVTASDTGGTVSPGAITYALTSGQTSAGTVTSAGVVTVTGAGTIYLTASQAASGNYGSTTATTSFTVNPETPVLSFASIPTKTYGDANFQVTASDSGSTPSAGAITYSLTSGQTSAGTVSSTGLVSITGAGTIYLTANQAANGNFAAGTATTTVTVNTETPILSFATIPTKTFGDANFQVTASDSGSTPSAGAITYSLTSGQTSAGTVSSTGLVSITGAGTIYLTATQAANGNYAVGTATTTVTVNAETPTLTFNTIPVHYYGDAAFQVTATDSSGPVSPGAITYSLTSGHTSAGTVTSGGLVTMTGSGTIYLTATQAASGNYAQTTATTTATISPALSITNGTTLPPGVVANQYGQTLTASGGSGNYTWSLISGSTALGNLGLYFTPGTPGVGATASVAGLVPIAGGPASFTVQVSDTASHSVQVTFSVTINANVTITTTTLSPTYAYIGSGYSTTINALGGASPYTWSISSGGTALAAAGLTLSSGTGLSNTISGTVASGTPNPLNFTVKVVDHNGVPTTQPYSLTVYSGLSLSTPSSTVPGPAIIGQTYTGNGINASGGSGSYSWAVTGLSAGLTYNATGNPLYISGTPPTTSQTLYPNVTLTDTVTNKTYGPIQYSIVVAPQTPLTLPAANPSSLPGANIGNSYTGYINASGGSGSGYVWSINGSQVATDATTPLALSDGLSAYNDGTAVLTIKGNLGSTPQTISLTNVTVTDSANDTPTPASVTYTIPVVNPLSGYTVSGSVIYSGSGVGWVYLELVDSSCSGCNSNIGTAIKATTAGSLASPGMAYTIHGVPPGTYTLQAWMDITFTDGTSGEVMGGYGGENASDPAGVSGSNVVVTSGPVTAANVTLLAATAPTLGSKTPTWDPSNGFGVFSGGAVVSYDPITNSNGIEIPNSYIVQWSLNNSFSPVAGSQCFPATAAQQPWIINGISGSGPYFFRAAGVIGSCASGAVGNYSASTSSSYSIADPSSSSGNLVQGTVSFSQTATGPLYVGFYDQNTGKVYVTVKGSTTNPPTSGVAYSLYVPTGSNYYNFGIVDQKNDGLFVPGNIANVNQQISQSTVITSGTNTVNLTLPSANSVATVKIQNSKNTDGNGNTNTGYNIDLRVNGLYKQPASVRLQSAPSYVLDIPADIATAEFSGNYDEWDYYPNLLNANPSTSDVFTFNVTYTDGTSNSTANSTPNPITASPTAILSAFPTLTYPVWNSTGVSPTPTFTWTYPANASSYTYYFQLQDLSNNTIWSIPAQHSHSNGFSSSISPSITWGVDPTGGNNTPKVNSLDGSTTYFWSIQVSDANGNEATRQMAFTTAQLPLSLPSGGTATALQSAPFQQTLNASGGTGSGYVFSVSVGTGSTNYSTVPVSPASSLSLGNGLYVISSGSALTFGGTPTSLGTTTVNVKVTDSGSDNAGPNTYNINVVSAPTGTNNSNLKGTYACKIEGYNDSDGSRWATLSNFTANGVTNNGQLSSGVFDSNGRDYGGAVYGTLSGSYAIGSDNNGLATIAGSITSGGGGTFSHTWAIALNNTGTASTVATEFRMVETDDVGTSPSGQHGTGDCYLTTPTTFVNNTFGNNGLGNGFAFGVKGENGSGVPKAAVGRITTSTGTSGGTITSGVLDGMRVDQSADNGGTVDSTKSTYSAPDGNGRVTLYIVPTGQTTGQTFIAYIINASKMFMLSTVGDSGMMVGDIRTQQQSSYSAANLNSAAVLYVQAYDGFSNNAVKGYDSSLYQVSGDGAGNLTINKSYDNNGGSYQAGQLNGQSVTVTFDSSNPGRATFSPGSDSAFMYFFNNNNAFYMDLSNNYVETGWLQAQSGTFTNAGLAGTYMMGITAPLVTTTEGMVGESILSSSGGITGTQSQAGEGAFAWDESIGNYSLTWDSTTYGTYLLGSGSNGVSCIVVNSTRDVCMKNTSSAADMLIFQQ